MELLRQETGWGIDQLTNLLIMVMLCCGIAGFIYEELFYRIDLGYFVKRGSSFGPWIPIYVFGGGAFMLFVYRFKSNPLLVFGLCVLVSGILEYVTGWVLHKFFNVRLWDYNTEILNFGNINGYVCLRSVLLFGISGVFIVYALVPFLIRIVNNTNPGILTAVCRSLAVVFVIDCISYRIYQMFK